MNLEYYHDRLQRCRWASDALQVDRDTFRNKPRTKKAQAILAVHLKRIRGEGSPAECDDVFNEVTK